MPPYINMYCCSFQWDTGTMCYTGGADDSQLVSSIDPFFGSSVTEDVHYLYENMIAGFNRVTPSPGKADPELVVSPTPSLSRTLPPLSDIRSSEAEITIASNSDAEKRNWEPSFHSNLETWPKSAKLSVGVKQDTMSTGGDDQVALELAASLSASPPTGKETPVTLNILSVNDNSWITEKKDTAIVDIPEGLIRKLQEDKTYGQKEIESIYDNSKYWSIAFTDGVRCCICNLSESPFASACLTICRDSRGINRHFKAAKHIGDRKDYHCTHPTHPCQAAFSRRDALTRHLRDVQHPRLKGRRKTTSSAGSKGRKVGTRGGTPRSLK